MVKWDIRREGHAWGNEATSRYQMTPEKTEMIAGRLYWTEEERLTMLALLLENVGADLASHLAKGSVKCIRLRFRADLRIPQRDGLAGKTSESVNRLIC